MNPPSFDLSGLGRRIEGNREPSLFGLLPEKQQIALKEEMLVKHSIRFLHIANNMASILIYTLLTNNHRHGMFTEDKFTQYKHLCSLVV